MKHACAFLLLSACALSAPDRQERLETAEKIGYSARLSPKIIASTYYDIYSFQRLTDPLKPVHIYIEGDGFAWESRTRPSTDPTPINPVALRLASVDTHPNVVYMARPCQYVQRKNSACGSAAWTSHRFSEQVVQALVTAIDKTIAGQSFPSVALYGYSGGGGLAMLVASRRDDVSEIRTIAGNLDTKLWVEHHGVSRLSGSINPLSVVGAVAKVPQLHIVGAEDKVMPPKLAEDIAKNTAGNKCFSYKIQSGYAHRDAWENIWPALRAEPLQCK